MRAQEDRLYAKLSSLKAQINQHFLFNTLNSIYVLAEKKDDKTADAVINLSELMRYIIKDAHNNKVSLEKELYYISNYIDLQHPGLKRWLFLPWVVFGVEKRLQDSFI